MAWEERQDRWADEASWQRQGRWAEEADWQRQGRWAEEAEHESGLAAAGPLVGHSTGSRLAAAGLLGRLAGQRLERLETPPGLSKVRPMKISKVQQEATELLAAAWTTLPEDTQSKLQAIGIGPTKPEAPELKDVLKSHMEALPQPVQELVTKLTTPEPCTEREIAAKLKGRVTELKNLSMKKTQLQSRIDQVKTQYAALLTDMQDLQVKLTEGQQALKSLSEEYMKAVNQTPAPSTSGEAEQIPMAVESFVHSLGISLTEEQKTQLHGLLKRPNQEAEDSMKRRKTKGTQLTPPGHCRQHSLFAV